MDTPIWKLGTDREPDMMGFPPGAVSGQMSSGDVPDSPANPPRLPNTHTDRRYMVILAACLALLAPAVLYGVKFRNAHFNFRYGFMVADTSGWMDVPKEGMVFSVATSTAASVVSSYVGVSPIAHADGISSDQAEKTAKEGCDSQIADTHGTFVSFSKTNLNGIRGFVCIDENKPEHVDAVYLTREYILINRNGKKFDYVIVATYPKGNAVEEGNVDRLIGGFRAL